MLVRRSAVLLLLLVLSAFPLAAQTPPLFEAVVSGVRNQCGPTQPPPARGVQWINPDRTDLSTDATTYIAMIGSADGRRVLALQRLPGPSIQVVEVRPDGTVTPISAPIAGYEPVGIDAGTNGRIFAVGQSPVPGPATLFVMSAAGAIEATYPINGGTDLELAPDNCTLYYRQGPNIGRFNGCTGTALPNFGPPDDYTDVHVLPDGRVVLATETSIHLYAADGTLIRTIVANVQTAFGLNSTSFVTEVGVSADLQTLFAGVSVNCNFTSNGILIRASFNTGAEVSRRSVEIHGVSGLVVGAPGPAVVGGAANVPTASEWTLILLAITLAAAGAINAASRW